MNKNKPGAFALSSQIIIEKGAMRVVSFILTLSLLWLTVFSMAACGDNKEYDLSMRTDNYLEKDYIKELLEEYEAETGVNVKAVSSGDADIIVSGGAVDGFKPLEVTGYGLALDKSYVDTLVGKEKTDLFIEDLRAASYTEWTSLVYALKQLVHKGEADGVTLNSQYYTFESLPPDINGVMAFSGSDRYTYADKLLDIVYGDISPAAISDSATSQAGIELLKPGLNTYINALEVLSSSVAGLYAGGTRGDDFTSGSFYSQTLINQIFMEGKAFFLIAGSSDYEELAKLNANKVGSLVFVPLKFEGKRADAIPAQVVSSIGYADDEPRDEVKAFYEWFVKRYDKDRNVLEESVKSYIDADAVIDNVYFETRDVTYAEYRDWKKQAFKSPEMKDMLKRASWSDKNRVEIVQFLAAAWFEE